MQKICPGNCRVTFLNGPFSLHSTQTIHPSGLGYGRLCYMILGIMDWYVNTAKTHIGKKENCLFQFLIQPVWEAESVL